MKLALACCWPVSIIDHCLLRTRSTIPFGWLIKLGRRIFSDFPPKSINETVTDDFFVTNRADGSTCRCTDNSIKGRRCIAECCFAKHLPVKSFNEALSNDVFVTDKADSNFFGNPVDTADRFCFKTRSTLPFGWLINLGRLIFFSDFPAKSFNGTIPNFVNKVEK